jgi:hypothetical protein
MVWLASSVLPAFLTAAYMQPRAAAGGDTTMQCACQGISQPAGAQRVTAQLFQCRPVKLTVPNQSTAKTRKACASPSRFLQQAQPQCTSQRRQQKLVRQSASTLLRYCMLCMRRHSMLWYACTPT